LRLICRRFGSVAQDGKTSCLLNCCSPQFAQLWWTFCCRNAGFSAQLASARGWDHGVFIPLLLMVQPANIPVVQLSLLSSLNPQQHLELGVALRPLREQGVFILGSGMSYHNMKGFTRTDRSRSGADEAWVASSHFHSWLNAAVCSKNGSERCVCHSASLLYTLFSSIPLADKKQMRTHVERHTLLAGYCHNNRQQYR
jgi:aromatic ring-opening dioxygenase catalytic subunit (LigB family)